MKNTKYKVKDKFKNNKKQGDRSFASGEGTKRKRKEEESEEKGMKNELRCIKCLYQLPTRSRISAYHKPAVIKNK